LISRSSNKHFNTILKVQSPSLDTTQPNIHSSIMLFNIKSTLLIGLVASTTLAAPSISLVARAKTPAKVNCAGKEFTAAELTSGITAARRGRGAYPKKFKNKNPAGAAVFPNHPVVSSAEQSNIWEMPIGRKCSPVTLCLFEMSVY
jgi:hypothetical protein